MGDLERLSGVSGSANASASDATSLENFDLAAAWLRRAEADRAEFFDRFVAIVSHALPDHTRIDKSRSGFFRKKEQVIGISVVFDNETYVMRMNDGHRLTTQVEKKVRGVVLSTRDVDAHAWMSGLMTHVRDTTNQGRAIAELLSSL
ncbi:hypothetical protein GCM10027093_75340 [Paraburkholderia jirisanensis]